MPLDLVLLHEALRLALYSGIPQAGPADREQLARDLHKRRVLPAPEKAHPHQRQRYRHAGSGRRYDGRCWCSGCRCSLRFDGAVTTAAQHGQRGQCDSGPYGIFHFEFPRWLVLIV